MERFFVIVGRLNSVLLLLVLLGVGATLVYMNMGNSRSHEPGVVEVAEVGNGTRKPVSLRLQDPERIAGAHTLMIALTTEGESSKLSSGGYGSETRNVLFLAPDDKAGRWLFKDHQRLILTSKQMPEERNGREEEGYPSRAIYFEYVERDTDGDGKLSKEDAATIGFTKPDGTGFMPVLKDVHHVFSHEMDDPGHVAIVYQAGTKVRHARIAVADFKVISDQEIIDVPAAL